MSLQLSQLLEFWWAHAAEASIQFACFAVALLILDVLLARLAAPELRAALWLAVLAKLLFPNAFPNTLHWSIPASFVPSGIEEPLRGMPTAESPVAWPARAAFAVWLTGVALFSLIGVARYRNLRRKRLNESVHAPQFVQSIAGDVARNLGLRTAAPVRIFDGFGGPVVLGFVHPVVLVPRSLLLSELREELELVLYHELAHVKRRDPLWSLFCISMQVLYWFHPLVWLARRRLTDLRELSCDQTVGRALGGDTANYRRTLLTLAQPGTVKARLGGLAFLTPRSQLALRVRLLERPISSNWALRQSKAALLFSLLFVCCLSRTPKINVPYPYQVPPLEDLEGCLQLRYAVLSMNAHAETVEGSELAPLLSQATKDSIQEE